MILISLISICMHVVNPWGKEGKFPLRYLVKSNSKSNFCLKNEPLHCGYREI